ncbi:hypothetical protein DFS34DRAFT_696720 [Phlyctochytrium arcticum]|nr:hypothetical protein DFS34DRAFT_696720 [Phlyctochytrium arcticum]
MDGPPSFRVFQFHPAVIDQPANQILEPVNGSTDGRKRREWSVSSSSDDDDDKKKKKKGKGVGGYAKRLKVQQRQAQQTTVLAYGTLSDPVTAPNGHFSQPTKERQNDDTILTIRTYELLSHGYGSYTWPSALVLAGYIYTHPSVVRSKRVLELGAGTGLPGMVAAKMGAREVVLTDAPGEGGILETMKRSVEANGVGSVCGVAGLMWGAFPVTIVARECLLPTQGSSSPSNENQPASPSPTSMTPPFDLLLGADVFYDPSIFDDLLSTVSYLLRHSCTPTAKFLTTYQERSSKRSIQDLLDKWGLRCRILPKKGWGGEGEVWTEVGGGQGVPREVGSVWMLVIELKGRPASAG